MILIISIYKLNIHKQVTQVTHYLSGVSYLYARYTVVLGSFKALGQTRVGSSKTKARMLATGQKNDTGQ